MSIQLEADFRGPMRNFPGGLSVPFVGRFDLINSGMVIGSETSRDRSSGVLVVNHNLKVEVPGKARIEFKSSIASSGNAPGLGRLLTLEFGQDYPGSPEFSKLRKGKYKVTMSDGVWSERQDETVPDPQLRITAVMHDNYSSAERRVSVDRGAGEYQVYELVDTRSNQKEVLFDSLELRGSSPSPANSDMIKATFEAASKFALAVREAIREADPSPDLGDVSVFEGPYKKNAPNLLDAFTVRAAE